MNYVKKQGMWAIGLLLATALSSSTAWAHAAHAGPMVTFIKEKAALKAILTGKGRKIVQRKEALSEETVEWVAEYFDEELESGEVVRFFLAKDRKDGHWLAAAITSEAPYKHGNAKLIIGVDADSTVLRVAVLGVNQTYVADFKAADKKGWLDALQGMPMTTLIDQGKALEAVKKASVERTVLVELKDSAVLLAAFLHQLK